MTNDSLKPIVIVGAGFTGLFTALHLRSLKCSRPIILIDRQWRFIFTPREKLDKLGQSWKKSPIFALCDSNYVFKIGLFFLSLHLTYLYQTHV